MPTTAEREERAAYSRIHELCREADALREFIDGVMVTLIVNKKTIYNGLLGTNGIGPAIEFAELLDKWDARARELTGRGLDDREGKGACQHS